MGNKAAGGRLRTILDDFGPLGGAVYAADAAWRKVRERVARAYWTACFDDVGPGFHVQRGLRVTSPRKIRLGANCFLGANVRLLSELSPGRLGLADRVQVNRDAMLDYSGGLELHDGVLISEGAFLYTHSHGYDPRSEPTATPLVVEHDVWIGARAMVMPGVGRIGARSVVAAGSVLTKEAPPGAILAGIPARVIGEVPSEASHAMC